MGVTLWTGNLAWTIFTVSRGIMHQTINLVSKKVINRIMDNENNCCTFSLFTIYFSHVSIVLTTAQTYFKLLKILIVDFRKKKEAKTRTPVYISGAEVWR